MKSMVITQFGDTSVFTEKEIPTPSIQPGHVLIKVKATSVNPFDCKLRKGGFPDLITEFPAILQGDVAGVIEQVGANVRGFSVGDEVYGCVGGVLNMGGGLAEYVLADVNLIALKPSTLTFPEAAALPLVALTAWEALVTYANVKPEQTVLIHGGTGGVGHIAIQLAKWLGAKVYATASSTPKMDIAKKLGADATINYKKTPVESYVSELTNNAGFNVVFDTVGGDNLVGCFTAAALFGKVVSIQCAGVYDLTPAFLKGLTICTVLQPLPLITGVNRRHYGEILTKIAELVDQKRIKPLIDEKIYSLHQVGEAHTRLETGEAVGKVVLSH